MHHAVTTLDAMPCTRLHTMLYTILRTMLHATRFASRRRLTALIHSLTLSRTLVVPSLTCFCRQPAIRVHARHLLDTGCCLFPLPGNSSADYSRPIDALPTRLFIHGWRGNLLRLVHVFMLEVPPSFDSESERYYYYY